MNETICAIATAPGGALGIIRVSGPQAFDAVSAICSVDCTAVAPNTVHFTRIIAPAATVPNGFPTAAVPASSPAGIIDEVLITVFRAPHSYTGEDCVEISCHGSRYVLNKVLELLIQHNCRMANPGEFTQRAYLNGKMDLSQAEAVADLIASTNRATHQLAISQLRGSISTKLSQLREQLLKLTSLLELELDFSDHEDLEFADRTELDKLAKNINKHISKLIHSFETGQALKQGIPVAIIGKTNVGKSTLLNRLLKDDRAIVSDIHGTTRDTIEDTIDIKGVTFRFIDTAGIRQTSDEVEQIGIERTYASIKKARIVIWVIDQQPSQNEFQEMLDKTSGKSLIITQNKIDKQEHLNIIATPQNDVNIYSTIPISAKHNINIDKLEKAIFNAADIPSFHENDVIVTNARHYDALTRAHDHLQRVLVGLGETNSQSSIFNSQLPPDLVAEDLRLTLDTLAEITGGQITPNEVLGNIFKNFCVGK